MNSLLYVGLDVHKNSISAVSYNAKTREFLFPAKIGPAPADVLKYLSGVQDRMGCPVTFECGYEAGGTGFGLQRFLNGNAIDCYVLAPSTMMTSPIKGKKKTDARDAQTIAQCLAACAYSPVSVPTPEDEAVRDYIRMRDDCKQALKRVKQQIGAFCLRHQLKFTDTKKSWTKAHIKWLRDLKLDDRNQETLDEYMLFFDHLTEKIERLDKRIVELSKEDPYAELAGKLQCFLGITEPQALAFAAEIGDFNRFPTATKFTAFLGLIPGEHSSGNTQRKLGITKAGNTHLRKVLIEAAGSFQRGKAGYKSVALKKRQEGQNPKDIAYADKANERLRHKCQKMILQGKPRNVAVTACARELGCFIWGMATEHTQ